MGLRPGHCYSDPDSDRAYCRLAVKVHKKNYIGAVPGLRTRQFNMGDPSKKYKYCIDLIAQEKKIIRDNSIESVRMLVNRYLVKRMGKEGFFIRIRVYPHRILREHKMAQGAGADRVSQGMSLAFGRPAGRAAKVNKGQKIMSLLVDEASLAIGKAAMEKANNRLSCKCKVVVHTDIKSIGSLGKKLRKKVDEEAKAAEAAPEAGKKEDKAADGKGEAKADGKADAKKEEPKKDAGKAEKKK